MGKTKAEEIRKELNETRGTKEPKVYCRHYESKRLTNHTANIVRDVVSRRLTKVHQPSHSMSSWFSRSDASSGIQWLAPSICS